MTTYVRHVIPLLHVKLQRPLKILSEDEVKAYIVLKPNEDLAPEEIIDWCMERVADFKIPRYLEFRESLPKTPTHRVEKYILKRESLAKAGIDMGEYIQKTGKGKTARGHR